MRTVPQAPPHLAYNFLTPSSPTAPAMDIALDSLETPTLTKAQLAEELFDNMPYGDPQPKPFIPKEHWTPPPTRNPQPYSGVPVP